MRSAVADEAPAYPSHLRLSRRGGTARARSEAVGGCDRPFGVQQYPGDERRDDRLQACFCAARRNN